MRRRVFLARSVAAGAAAAAPWSRSIETAAQPIVRYPDPSVVTLDPRFDRLRQGNAAVERLWTGARWAEGPAWFADGNLWAAAGWGGEGYDGVHIFSPDGLLIGKITLPETCANLSFGGAKRNRLFMTASQSLYSLFVNTQGAKVP
jgi:gluconolactonase